jgi:hypothetical protein
MTSAEILAANPRLTYRQLDHWCRKGWIQPDVACPGSGKPRTFPAAEVRVLKRMALLVARGTVPSVAAGRARAEVETQAHAVCRTTGTGWPELAAVS